MVDLRPTFLLRLALVALLAVLTLGVVLRRMRTAQPETLTVLPAERPAPDLSAAPSAETPPAAVASLGATGRTGVMDPTAGTEAARRAARLQALLTEVRQKLTATPSEDARAFLQASAETDPALAMEVARQAARTDLERYQLASGVLEVWARKNVDQAWEWAVREGGNVNQAADGPSPAYIVLSQVVATDPRTMIGLAESALDLQGGSQPLGIADIAQSAVTLLLANGAGDLARAAIERWSKTPLAASVGPAALEQAANDLARTSPASAAAWVEALPADLDGRAAALATISGQWALSDPAGAVAWADRLPPSAGRIDAVKRAVHTWAETDLVAASTWLLEHEADQAIDPLLADMAAQSRLTLGNPPAAMTLAGLIMDDIQRTQTTEAVLQQWARRDADAARRYIVESTDFSQSEKERLMGVVNTITGGG